MNCNFDWCEFNNVFFGGLITGVVASFLFVWLTNIISTYKFRRNYKHLKSITDETFDWIAYSMRPENGRKRQDNPNGSTINIKIKKDRIYISLKHGIRQWNGELNMEGFDFGVVAYKYATEHEYGKRDCVIGTFEENGKTYDYLFLTPTNDKIYYIQKIAENKWSAIYNYDNEIFIRERGIAFRQSAKACNVKPAGSNLPERPHKS